MALIELRENTEEVTQITNDAAEFIVRQFNQSLGEQSIVIPTLTYSFLVGTIQYLGAHKESGKTIMLNLFDMISIGINHTDVEAEKDGNYVPVIEITEEAHRFVENTNDPRTFFKYDEEKEEIKEIIDIATTILKKRFDINIMDSSEIIARSTYAFIASAISYLSNNRQEEGTVEINFLQLFDLGLTYVEEETDSGHRSCYKLFCVPGQEMKLLIKDDDKTEETIR